MPNDEHAELLETAKALFGEAVTLATQGPRRVPHPDATHDDGYLLPSAVMAKMSEATSALREIARARHRLGEESRARHAVSREKPEHLKG